MLPLDDAVVIADGALSRQQGNLFLQYQALYDALMGCPRRGGSVKAQKVARLVSSKEDSPGETLTRLRLAEYGLHPVQQYTVHTDHSYYEGDFAFEAHKIMVEFDGA